MVCLSLISVNVWRVSDLSQLVHVSIFDPSQLVHVSISDLSHLVHVVCLSLISDS